MSSWSWISTASQTSSTLNSHREQQVPKPTKGEFPTRDEVPAFPRSKDKFARPSTGPKNYVARKPLSPNDSASRSIAIIVGGFVAGVSLAIIHHIFLTLLNGRNIDEYPQYWVKNANNALSAMFSLCITLVATSSLIQMKWNVARSKPLSIRSIDDLFSLPSPLALLTTVTSTRLRSLRLFLLPIFAATFIQILALVSVFAPNALTVAPSAEISRDLLVRTLDLSTGPVGPTMDATTDTGTYISASQLWTTVLTSIMLQPPTISWKIPPGCGVTCKFDLVYDGPGLQCNDIPLEPPPYPLIYNATSTLYPNPRHNNSWLWEIEDQYELQIHSIATGGPGFHPEGGQSVHCVFRKATYKASFQVENNTMEVNHVIQSYGDILGAVAPAYRCAWSPGSPCFINGVNTRAMCEVFASGLTGKIQWPTNNNSEVAVGMNEAVMDLLFSHSSYGMYVDFQLGVCNLSESLVSLFSNLTLGFIPLRSDTTTVRADLWDGSYAWSYTVWILWAVYLPTLLLASLVIFNGLLSIRSNKRGMDDKFSNFFLATKDIELDEICMDVEDFAELQQLRLLYQREKGTFSVLSVPSRREDVKRRFD